MIGTPAKRIGLSATTARLALLQISVMLNSGVTMTRALEALIDHGEQQMKELGMLLLTSVASGHRFSQSLARASHYFSKAQLSVVSIGEKTGALPTVLSRLSDQLEREQNLRRSVVGSMVYPVGTLVLSILMALFMVNYMLPHLMATAGKMLKSPPWPTRVLMSIAEHGGLVTTLCLILLCCIPWLFSSVPQARAIRTWAFFESPVMGRIGANVELAKLCRQLSLLLAAGSTISGALSAINSQDVRLNTALRAVLHDLHAGATLSEGFRDTGVFSPTFVSLVEVGEETGRLSSVLEHQAVMLEEATHRELQDLVKLVEPLTMGIVGAVVGFVIVGCLVPVYQVALQGL